MALIDRRQTNKLLKRTQTFDSDKKSASNNIKQDSFKKIKTQKLSINLNEMNRISEVDSWKSDSEMDSSESQDFNKSAV